MRGSRNRAIPNCVQPTMSINEARAEPPAVVLFSTSSAGAAFFFVKGVYEAECGESNRLKFVPKGRAQDSPSVTLLSGLKVESAANVLRLLARVVAELAGKPLYGRTAIEACEVDFYVNLAYSALKEPKLLDQELSKLNARLQMRTFLVGYEISIADLAVWTALNENKRWPSLRKQFENVRRWFSHLSLFPQLASILESEQKAQQKMPERKKGHDGSKITLDDCWMGKVVTRFPPEPSGYLHIGHAKAAILNHDTARRYNGRMLLRFDDTNPAKEKDEFVNAIIEDLATLGIKHDGNITHSSDYFNQMIDMATQLLQEGKAYVDKTPVDEMRKERMEGIESVYREQSIEENLRIWNGMQQATEEGLSSVVRAKIDMKCLNKAMRDPAIYRCNLLPHHRTGRKYNVYPTYDFCCPVIDSIEGVTHAMRTTEYHDRNDQYYWFIDALQLRKPIIYDFSRLNLVYTVMSKRKLKWLVENERVSGWDDPRFPTVRGLVRRGLCIAALTEFVVEQGASKATNLMHWDKLWNINKKLIDVTAHRYTAVAKQNIVPLTLNGFDESSTHLNVRLHPKDASKGTKTVAIASTIYLEHDDAQMLQEGEEVTLMSWGNTFIDTIERRDGVIVALTGTLNLGGDFKKTKKKLTWISSGSTGVEDFVETTLVELDYLITAPKLEDGQFEGVLNDDTWHETAALGESSLRLVKKGEVIQLNRRGFFICDQPYVNADKPLTLIFIPDGHSAHASTLSRKVDLK